jgi:hypothetical protein
MQFVLPSIRCVSIQSCPCVQGHLLLRELPWIVHGYDPVVRRLTRLQEIADRLGFPSCALRPGPLPHSHPCAPQMNEDACPLNYTRYLVACHDRKVRLIPRDSRRAAASAIQRQAVVFCRQRRVELFVLCEAPRTARRNVYRWPVVDDDG